MKENLAKLTILKDIPEEIFINDFQKYGAAKYNLQTTIEAMFDLDSQGVYGLAQICGAAGAGKVNPLKCLALSPISILNSDISRPDPLYLPVHFFI